MHPDGTFDASSDVTIEPTAIAELGTEVPERVMAGMVARWEATYEGRCSGCGAAPTMLNRWSRRRIWPGRKAQFDGYVQHGNGCLAMAARVRQWAYENRRMVG
jgi:hypothetical protein